MPDHDSDGCPPSPADGEPSAATLEQRRWNEEARHAFMDEFPLLSAAEVAGLAAAPEDREVTVRMLAQGQLLVLPIDGRYPAFQFDLRGRPKPVVVDVCHSVARRGVTRVGAAPVLQRALGIARRPACRRRP